MDCNGNCKLCPRLIISTAVTFTGGNLIINIPEGSYQRGCHYCIVIAQSIPAAATINAPVYITIGADTVLYPLNKCDCTPATACLIHARMKYPVTVNTTATGGSFRLRRKVCCAPVDGLASLPAPAAAAALVTGDGA